LAAKAAVSNKSCCKFSSDWPGSQENVMVEYSSAHGGP
jgi:hypothetical protein